MPKGFYDVYIGRVEDSDIREWINEEINFVEKLVAARRDVSLADLLPEYR